MCGTVRRAWDPTDNVPGRVGIGFVLVPAADDSRAVLGTIVAHEGGPGYPATGTAASYRALFRPLLERRNLLMVDQRGTGRSSPIDCPELQDLVGSYADAAEVCGARLGDHAHLFGTELAADDLATVVDALGLGPIDLYGDSYGTFFAQVVLGRHPELLRSVILDAAYPTYGEDAWFETQAPALRRSLEVVCSRVGWCADQLGSPVDRLAELVDRLRTEPVDGVAPGGDGKLHRVLLEPSSLARVAYSGTYVPTTYRELDAAVRASLDGDHLPMLRLLAEADHPGGGVSPPKAYSEGHDAAVSCHDYPQVFDVTAPRSVRETQLAAAIADRAATEPDTYAPFTVPEQVASRWMTIDWCLGWPAPPPTYEPGPPVPPGGSYADVPTMVISGELDTITTSAEGVMVVDQLPGATLVIMANGLHVAALDDLDGCAASLVRRFVRTTVVSRTACADDMWPIHTAPPFWAMVADAVPADPVGDLVVAHEDARLRLRAASVAVATTGDALARWWQSYASRGRGLRGGTWATRGYRVVTMELDGYQLATDLAVSGTVRWDRRSGLVESSLELGGSAGLVGSVEVGWNALEPHGLATVVGRVDGHAVDATTQAP